MHTFTTYPGRAALLRHTRVGPHFYDIPGSVRSLTTYPGQEVGRLPLQVTVEKNMINYWLHLLNKDEHTLSHIIYTIISLYNLSNRNEYNHNGYVESSVS